METTGSEQKLRGYQETLVAAARQGRSRNSPVPTFQCKNAPSMWSSKPTDPSGPCCEKNNCRQVGSAGRKAALATYCICNAAKSPSAVRPLRRSCCDSEGSSGVRPEWQKGPANRSLHLPNHIPPQKYRPEILTFWRKRFDSVGGEMHFQEISVLPRLRSRQPYMCGCPLFDKRYLRFSAGSPIGRVSGL